MDNTSIISILAQNSTHSFDDAVDQLAAIAEPKLFEQAIAYAHTPGISDRVGSLVSLGKLNERL